MWAKQFWNLFFLYFSNKQISQSVFSNLLSAASSCEVRRTTSTIVHSLIAHKHLSTPTCAVLCCSFFFFFFSCAAVSCVYCSVAQGWLLSVVLILPCPPLPSGSIGSNCTQQLQSFIFIYFSPLNSFFFLLTSEGDGIFSVYLRSTNKQKLWFNRLPTAIAMAELFIDCRPAPSKRRRIRILVEWSMNERVDAPCALLPAKEIQKKEKVKVLSRLSSHPSSFTNCSTWWYRTAVRSIAIPL